MTDHVNRMIDEALIAEERDLLRRIGEEPAYFAQLGDAFTGRLGWVNGVMMLAQALLFLAGIYGAIQFFAADDPLTAIRWGIPAAVLVLMSLMIKLAIWPTIQTNRVLREFKRLELMLSRRAD